MIRTGSRLGPYEVLSALGAGGMGEVWRATDTRLGREVAVKILPAEFSQNAQLRVRFEQEAKSISRLNHPNICTLYDVGQADGFEYLVMELLEGESLAERLARGPLPLGDLLRYGTEIAEGLAAAHRQGIIHRDIKPANVVLTKGGAKLLDFGLAKAAPSGASSEEETQHRPLTREGTVLGTYQYMAPEQIAGEETDTRSDIFALGLLLYEMATGQRAFTGNSRASLIAAITGADPRPIRDLQPLTPPVLEHIIRKCLEKEPDARWQSAWDVASELRWIREGGSEAGVATSVTVRRHRRELLAWITTAAAVVVAAAIAWKALEWRQPHRQRVESSILVPDGTRTALNAGMGISPDGSMIAVILDDLRGTRSLWVRSLATADFRRLEGTQDAEYPFWSPDSRRIGFFAGGKLKVIDSAGGPPRILTDAPGPRGASWGRNGTILFASSVSGPLMRISEGGGTAVAASTLQQGETGHRWPAFFDEGDRFLYVSTTGPGRGSGLYAGAISKPAERTSVLNVASAPVVSGSFLLYAMEDQIVAQRFDRRSANVSGAPQTILAGVAVNDRLSANFSVSSLREATLLAQRGVGFLMSELIWVDREGKLLGTVAGPNLFFSPRLSNDGTLLAVDRSSMKDGLGDIWIYDLGRGVPTRLTFQAENESGPQWSRDDRFVYFHRGPQGASSIERTSAGGTGESESVVVSSPEKRLSHVSRDGRWILFDVLAGEMRSDIWVYSADDKTAKAWLSTPFNERGAELSPDGRWIAYQSDESGQSEIYVRTFPRGDRKWLITAGGGAMPAWRADGRELFYVSPDEKMMSVPIGAGEEFLPGTPAPLFDAHVRSHANRQFDVAPDGSRFLLNRVASAPPQPLTLIVNALAEVEE